MFGRCGGWICLELHAGVFMLEWNSASKQASPDVDCDKLTKYGEIKMGK